MHVRVRVRIGEQVSITRTRARTHYLLCKIIGQLNGVEWRELLGFSRAQGLQTAL
jgi:hypothetical protein